ncbi:hypothetical protein OQY15_13500 [Pedobacter sp. MC2016-15]|uniref:hypothetical protein n=1 Tax=Pedobacter sp. MC2016-15 TaxID=2994473 RepID=UPI0022471D2D|nr:hypothetical protein [Pedobacter sp. MC2016-15]MCX2480110.1 hypothetical protein [Pedobacter sp. MC2016-15]
MKRIILAVIFGVASLSSINTKAQVNVSINIGSQPQWGPAGYNHVDYYYLPDVDAYYNVPARQYVYLNNGAWVWRNSLPSQYRGFDLYNSYKVVMNTPKPYLSHQTHIREYSRYKGYKGKQANIRDSKTTRYVSTRNNPGRGKTTVRTKTVRNTSVKTNNGRNERGGRGR